jgi:hypothetical protein
VEEVMCEIGSRLTTTIHGPNSYSGNSLLISYIHPFTETEKHILI